MTPTDTHAISRAFLAELDVEMPTTRRLLDVPLPSIYGPTADERW